MNNRTDFDVIIIGAGPSGIFCAYELIKERPSLNILMVEKGRPIEKRVCPKRTTKVCVGCRPCSITTGCAGAGAFSDGKLSLSPDVGGNLPDILGYDKALELIHESDDIYLKFGADTNVYGVDKQKEIQEIRRRAIMANLKLIECPIRHLGTEEGYKIYTRLQEHLLSSGVRIEFNTMVQDILMRTAVPEGSSPIREKRITPGRSCPPLAARAPTGSPMCAGTTGSRQRSAPWTSASAWRSGTRSWSF